MRKITKLDYTLENLEDRIKLTEQIIAENPDISQKYLEVLGNYLIMCMDKQERKQRKILTENRLATVNKRETSFEGLTIKFTNNEDGIYNLITENKNLIFQPKVKITKDDVAQIPMLQQLRTAIQSVEDMLKQASGRAAFILKQTLIDLRKDQYLIKDSYRRPITMKKLSRNNQKLIRLEDTSYIDKNNNIKVTGISLMDPKCVSLILTNYSRLKQDSYEDFNSDTWYLLQDFDEVSEKALSAYPVYEAIVTQKIDGLQNYEIQANINAEFGVHHSLEYISSLWRNKIPKLIATQAQKDFITFDFKRNQKLFKKCSRCGNVKPAHALFFSKNKTSKDQFYSICKECRRKTK